MVTSYFRYLLKRKSEYGIHSPFVYDFMRKVLNDNGSNRDYETIYRIARLVDKRKHFNYNLRKQSRLLYRLVRYYEPDSVVSFGHMSALNATAMALGHMQTKVYLEQSESFLEILNASISWMGTKEKGMTWMRCTQGWDFWKTHCPSSDVLRSSGIMIGPD